MAFEIVHISDIHLGQRKLNRIQRKIGMNKAEPDAYQALRNAVTGLLARPTPKTIAILSGDLSIIGGMREIGNALDDWNTLTGGQECWVLGNHDFWNGRVLPTALRHDTVHRDVRAAYWPADRVTSVTDGDMRVSIYELDTTPQEGLRGLYTNVIAKGELPKWQIDEMRALIEAQGAWTRGPDVVLAVMHHPVGVLRDALRVGGLLRDEPAVRAIMSGHTHVWAYHAPSFLQATCGSSTFASEDDGPPKRKRPPSFLVHRLERSGKQRVLLHRRVWELDGTAFRPLPATAVPGPFTLIP